MELEKMAPAIILVNTFYPECFWHTENVIRIYFLWYNYLVEK